MAVFNRNNKYFTDQSCYITKATRGVNTPLHTHDFLEIVYVFSGNSLHTVNGMQYAASAGDLLFIDLGCTHSFTCGKRFSYANIILKPEFISREPQGFNNAFSLLQLDDFKDLRQVVDPSNRLVHLSPEESELFEGFIKLVLSEQNANNGGKELLLRSVFNALLIFTFRKMALPMKEEGEIGVQLLDYLKANCTQRLSLEKISADCHYSPAHFSRLFKKYTGQTFTQYVTSCRLDVACRLLCETEMSVDEICSESGFTNRTKFFTSFEEKFGCTPLKYRKTIKNNVE